MKRSDIKRLKYLLEEAERIESEIRALELFIRMGEDENDEVDSLTINSYKGHSYSLRRDYELSLGPILKAVREAAQKEIVKLEAKLQELSRKYNVNFEAKIQELEAKIEQI